ncbi:D-alanine-D-alanine ligase [Sulfobacillus thermosulfidooxidans DSM 9293]|uniref:D-alanine--D-alanine ligase n=1 Tax=Sulfobacillus thermosulfidooxidans (strain DSM 9293 / VKM B-1269 / AT-1) TaxID=929705 RepID=A0A1W1WB63_SULTA|nr:D-alanine--D-alanine ligase [Sulfobacillus thermosulfidooxidans]SMC03524.1 D-alanine-D-alanine ligase [Sulfobacillus thermosulfidooxidans DSM 9293]
MTKPHVMVLMGGPSAEYSVSMSSGRMVFNALASLDDFCVDAIVIHENGDWEKTRTIPEDAMHPSALVHSAPPRQATLRGIQLLEDADVVFIALHGAFGEDGTIQAVLDTLHIPYTGSGPLASALAMNKHRAKELFQFHRLPTAPEFYIPPTKAESIERLIPQIETRLGYPLVVKPNEGGSSVGIHMTDNRDALRQALEEHADVGVPLLVEKKLVGRELTCAVLEDYDGSVTALPLIEIVPHAGNFFDFTSKYADGGSDEICPAQIDHKSARRIQDLAVRAHQILGCRGFSRSDFILTTEGPILLEVNTIPGMTPNSLLPKAAKAYGLEFPQLMRRLIYLAMGITPQAMNA